MNTTIIYDRWNEFLGHAFENSLIKNKYRIKDKSATTENPQASSILERIHQFKVNLVHTFDLKIYYLDKDDPWPSILAATVFAVHSTYHTMLQASPVQLVFGRDMISNTPFIVDWDTIMRRKQQLTDKNIKNKNKTRKLHSYKVHKKSTSEQQKI